MRYHHGTDTKSFLHQQEYSGIREIVITKRRRRGTTRIKNIIKKKNKKAIDPLIDYHTFLKNLFYSNISFYYNFLLITIYRCILRTSPSFSNVVRNTLSAMAINRAFLASTSTKSDTPTRIIVVRWHRAFGALPRNLDLTILLSEHYNCRADGRVYIIFSSRAAWRWKLQNAGERTNRK